MDGLLYWQINDIWPGATWSSIDVHGRWKALQFFAKRFFAPVLVSILESVEDETIEFHISNHLPEGTEGTLRWEISTCDGTVIREGTQLVTVASQCNEKALTLDVTDLRSGSPALPLEIRTNNSIPREADRNLLIWAWFEQDGIEVSRNLGFLAKPKYLRLEQPEIELEIESIDGTTVGLILRTDRPAPWTQLELVGIEGAFSDNFIHLHPRREARLQINLEQPIAPDHLRDAIRITPLISRSR
jgi:beta-mannosidase